MTDSTYSHDEIDLIALIQSLWDAKFVIAILTGSAAIFGFVLTLILPQSFSGSLKLMNASESVYTKYEAVNETLSLNNFNYKIDAGQVFELFVAEFSDYEEVLSVLSSDKIVTELAANIPEDERQQFLRNLAADITLNQQKGDKNTHQLTINWHDDHHGTIIVDRIINEVLLTVQQTLIADIKSLAQAIDSRNAQAKERLQAVLKSLENSAQISQNQRLLFLSEQAAIARELGIENNSLDGGASSFAGLAAAGDGISVSSVPFYLRGYKAIDKEIALLQSRTREDQFLMTDEYRANKQTLFIIENDVAASQILTASDMIAQDDRTRWVQIEATLFKLEPNLKPYLVILVATFLGVICAILYVLFANAMRARQTA
ncbi:MAG: Wzz/FepE/Etk N-terminal domain-containing protein [Candidatus Puniceispirillaceae bacterium]